jgi:hypothetical protein
MQERSGVSRSGAGFEGSGVQEHPNTRTLERSNVFGF